MKFVHSIPVTCVLAHRCRAAVLQDIDVRTHTHAANCLPEQCSTLHDTSTHTGAVKHLAVVLVTVSCEVIE